MSGMISEGVQIILVYTSMFSIQLFPFLTTTVDRE